MTQSEQDALHGRVIRELKAAKREVVALQKKLSLYVEKLRDTAAAIEYFISHPTAKGHDERLLADHGYHWNQEMRMEEFPQTVHELFVTAKKVEKLEAEAKAFNGE